MYGMLNTGIVPFTTRMRLIVAATPMSLMVAAATSVTIASTCATIVMFRHDAVLPLLITMPLVPQQMNHRSNLLAAQYLRSSGIFTGIIRVLFEYRQSLIEGVPTPNLAET